MRDFQNIPFVPFSPTHWRLPEAAGLSPVIRADISGLCGWDLMVQHGYTLITLNITQSHEVTSLPKHMEFGP